MKMRQRIGLLSTTLIALLLTACSSHDEFPHFDDEDIRFSLIDTLENPPGNLSYTIEVTNQGNVEIGFLRLFLDYPLKQQNGSRSNPFKTEGKTDVGNPVKLPPNEKAYFYVSAPVADAFGDNVAALDFDHPNIGLDGYVIDGKKTIPFSIHGGLSVLTSELR